MSNGAAAIIGPDKLAGRSVDDVKVNAPFLLAMQRAGESARAAHVT
jgi:hypothetical protein